MLKSYAARPQLIIARTILAACCLILLLLLSPARASAHTINSYAGGLSLQINAGFNENYRLNYWTPVRITLNNSGPIFNGTLNVLTFTAQGRSITGPATYSPWNFEVPVKLAKGTQKQITLNIPFYVGQIYPFGVEARVLDTQGHVVITQRDTPNYLNPNDILAGVLSDNSAGFGPLSTVLLPNHSSSIVVTPLDAASMPATAEVLSSFDILIFDDFTTSRLNAAQRSALVSWVNQGGALMEVGGADWQRTLNALPSNLQLVDVHGIDTLPAGTHLLPADERTPGTATTDPQAVDTLQQPVAASIGTLRTKGSASTSAGETVLSSGTTPLLIQAQHGQGTICYLAFDPAVQPFPGWSAIQVFWKSLLYRMVGDRALIGNSSKFSTGPGDLLPRQGVEQIVQPPNLFSPWIAAVLFLVYILVLGPLRILLVRRLKRPQWSWRISLSCIVFFSLFSYGLSFYSHGASLLDNSISIVQLNADGSPAHITTYLGVFTPDDGDFQVRFPAGSFVLPVSYPLSAASSIFSAADPHVTLTPAADGVSAHEPNAGKWTFHALVAEQDRQLPGKITADLTLRQNRLVGSVTNTLDTSLNDVFVLLPHSFVSIGHLAAGETQPVNLPMQNAPSKQGATLAGAIALSNGLPSSYFPYSDNGQAQSDFQRHMATLSALSGAGNFYTPCGGPCITQAVMSKGAVFTAPPGTPETLHLPVNSDPLLLKDAQATLIGWADTPLDDTNAITINNTTPNGFHDNLVELPVNLDLAQNVNVPPNILQGRIIDEQNSDVELTAPDTYALTSGTVTVEFALPLAQQPNINSLTLTEPNAIFDLIHKTHPGVNGDLIQASLFNWQTMVWDRITLFSGVFTTASTATYIGPGGRLLLQVANEDSSGLLLFARPSLSLK
jgi:uncharacterized membrane protein YhaH (DUF805 family)